MNRNNVWILLVCLVFFSACARESNRADSPGTRLPGLGIALEIPENFLPMPEESLVELEAMTLAMAPFTAIPRYAYAEISGRAFLIISELILTDGINPGERPFDSIHAYKRNLKAHFGVEEITNETIVSNNITTLFLAMLLGDDSLLFKGLSYISPNRFVMIDLYILYDVSPDEALGLQNIFNSLRISL